MHQDVDVLPVEDELTFIAEDFDIEIPCDISLLRVEMSGLPKCQGDPARWVAFRATGCCGKAPKFRLVCDFCKTTYQNWVARQAYITCAHCGEETGGFIHYEPIRKH